MKEFESSAEALAFEAFCTEQIVRLSHITSDCLARQAHILAAEERLRSEPSDAFLPMAEVTKIADALKWRGIWIGTGDELDLWIDRRGYAHNRAEALTEQGR